MREPEVCNAVIDSLFLGIEDHGIFTFNIGLDYGGAHQGFGGYTLDNPGPKGREGTKFGCCVLLKILQTLEVDSWDKLKGKPCRARISSDRLVTHIGHLLKDKWFSPKELAEEMGL